MTTDTLIEKWSQYKNPILVSGMILIVIVFLSIALWEVVTFEVDTQDIEAKTQEYLDKL